jgi:hypothetical protein
VSKNVSIRGHAKADGIPSARGKVAKSECGCCACAAAVCALTRSAPFKRERERERERERAGKAEGCTYALSAVWRAVPGVCGEYGGCCGSTPPGQYFESSSRHS